MMRHGENHLQGDKPQTRLVHLDTPASIALLGIPTFQFYKDLDPSIIRHFILKVSDNQRIVSFDPDGKKLIDWRDHKSEIRLPAFQEVSIDGSLFLQSDATSQYAFNAITNRTIQLQSSPIMGTTLEGCNEVGIIFGAQYKKGDTQKVSYARAWFAGGEEWICSRQSHTHITAAEPMGNTWFAGTSQGNGAIIKKDEIILLDVLPEGKAVPTSINGSGLVGGYLKSNETEFACVWGSDGIIQFLGEAIPGKSQVKRVLEDGAYIIESAVSETEKLYWIGKRNEVLPFTSDALKSIEGFPLVSIDAISPTGMMVVTIMEPSSQRCSRCLVGPEAIRHNRG